MNNAPSVDNLRAAYAKQALSVFSVGKLTDAARTSAVRPSVRSSLVFATKGTLNIVNRGIELACRPGTVAHVCADPNLAFEVPGDEACTHISITYVWGRATDRAFLDVFDAPWSLALDDADHVLKRVCDLEELGNDPDLESRLNQIIGATAFLKTLFDDSASQAADEGLRRAKAYMDTHYAQPLTLDQLGSIAGLSAKRFSERFSQAFGCRPTAYLIGQRMEHANELLATDMLVKDVAKMVGYDDQFYFSRIYRKYCGQSPEQARKALRP